MAQKAYRTSANGKKAKGDYKKSKTTKTEYQKTRDEFKRKKRKAPRPSPVTCSH